MGETDGDVAPTEERPSQEPDERPSPAPDTLKVPTQKRRRVKSPTPLGLRGRSATPIRGRSQTPFSLYLTRRSATPSTWRSITPFLKREDKEKTPFELGRDIKTQLYCNKAVFDKALIMDITEPEVPPVRYITSDMSVIDRAAVMDVSNVEVIYVVEEYEEYTEEEEEEIVEEVKPKKKEKKGKKGKGRRTVDRDESPGGEGSEGRSESEIRESEDREESQEPDGEPKKTKKKTVKKKEKKESSPKLTLKLEMGAGAKASKKMFDQAPPPPPPARPPPKKSKLVLQLEEQAKAAKAAAEEAAKRESERPKGETFEERQKRLKAEAEEQARIEAEIKAQQELEAAELAAELAAQEQEEHEEHEEEGSDEGSEGEGGQTGDEEGEEGDHYGEEVEHDEDEEHEEDDEFEELPVDRRESNVSVDSFTRPDPEDEEKWKKIAEEEGEEFMLQLRKYSMAQARSERERDADWQKRREQARLPHFINFLTDRTAEAGHSVRLACAVGGPDLSVKWFKDGKQLERDATHRIINNNNILALEIVNTVTTDSGEYSCVIANTNDEVTSSCIVTIYEVYKDEPSPPTFSLIRDFYHLHDDELTIECHIHGIPRPKVTWLFGAFELKPSYKFTLLEEAHGVYKLLIFRPTSKDSGKYVCKAVNDSGEAQISHAIEVAKNKNFHVHGIFHARDRISREKESVARQAMEEALASKKESDRKRAASQEPGRVRSSVNEPLVSPKNKLKIATQLRDRMALEGATIKLFCNVEGPSPACRWMKDDKWIQAGPNIRNLTEEGKAVLELVKVTAEASGQYKLVAKNEYSEVDSSCYLKVYGTQIEGDEQEPMFALPLRDVYHSSENDLIIGTKVRGNPRPTISWTKDSQPVVSDDRTQQIEHLDGVCELIINKPTPKDSGEYCCVAENKLGSVKIKHTVVVDQLPASRRSSGSTTSMGEDKDAGGKKGDKGSRPPKGKKKEDEVDVNYERKSRIPDIPPKTQLYFVGNITNRYLAEGNKVKLQAVIGGPDPQIKWQKDGQNLTYGPRIRNMSRDGLAVLEFLKTEVADSGKYTVIARNEYSEISNTALLHVYEPKVSADIEPVFIRSLKETYHLNTNELILETGARGEPAPTLTWYKDSVEIKNEDRYQIINHPDGTAELIIDNPTEKDSGKYVVKAENRVGKSEIGHHVLFEGKESHIAENIHGVFHADKNLMRRGHKEEERPPSAAGTDSEAEGEGKGKKAKKGKKKEEEEVIEVPDVPVKEEKREKRIGIHFKAKATDRVVAEGSRVKLTAYLEANEPQVKWFRDDEPLAFGPKVRHSYREGLCTLELVSAAVNDSGNYKCVARDGTGEVSTACKLEVYARPDNADVPPTFTRSIKDSYHGKVNEIVLDVHVRGLPTPTISWVKDGVKIEPSDKYQLIDHPDGTCELFISNPLPADSGKYVCQAENRKDKAEIAHMVHIEVKKPRAASPAREAPKLPPSIAQAAEEKEKKKKKKEDASEEGSSRREVPPPPDLRKRLYFRNYLSNRTVAEGSSVKWVINIDGPDPTARWFRNDQLIAFGPKSKLACQDGIAYLQLKELTVDDAGEIKLIVKGSENEIQTTCTLFVYSLSKEEMVAPVFTVGIKDTYSLNEDELVLDCRVRGKPRPEIQWMKESDMIDTDEKYRVISQPDGYCKLIIDSPTEKDAGLYSCVARNAVQEEKITHQVDFQGRDKFILEKTHGFFHRDPNKPHLTNPLGNHTVTPGGTITLQAEFLPTSSPIDVQWFREKKPLTGQPNVRTFMDHGVYTLAIQNAAAEWEGIYTCRATNAYGRLESHANVDIAAKGGKTAGPPLFLSRPETEMKIAVGDPFSISFRLQGEPKPKLTLLKGTKDITKSDRVSKEASDDYIRFTVAKSHIADSGTYFVVARNEFGTDRVFVTITVLQRARSTTPTSPRWGQPLESYPDISYFRDPPGPISTEPTVIDASKNHISLSWGKPQSANSAPVIAYRVDTWIVGKEGGAVWKEIGMTPINSFDAFNLVPTYEYHFRVTPKNRYGWGPSVQTSSPVQVGGAECLPEFVKILAGQTKALLNRECSLECVVQGAPRPKILWYKDGLQIDSSDRVRVKQSGSVCTLFISQVFEVDSGRYTCEATNSKGRVSTFARLQVVADEKLYAADHKLKELVTSDNAATLGEAIPIFTMRLRDRRVQVTYPVRLTCQVMGYPRPEIFWYKDDEIIEHSRRAVITDDGQFNTLEINSTKLDDSGVYTCTARNELGSVSCHCSLFVDKGIRAYISPDFYMPLEPFYIFKEGREIRLSAKVEAYPSVGVSWHRNGVKLRPSRRILATLDSNGFVELIIAEATQRDAGIYVCVASNAVGRTETSSRVTVEEVTEEERKKMSSIRGVNLPYSKEPLFVVKPRSSQAYEGDTVIIFCEVIGDPKPEVVWLRDFLKPEYYKDAPHFRRVGDGPEYRLEIPSAKLDFTGTYSVIASNCHGQTQAIISLQIYAKDINKLSSMEKGSIRHGNVETLPLFIRPLKDLRCCDGDAVTLECHVEAVPEPVIIWEKDGHVLHSGKDFDMVYDGTKAVLSIRRVYPEDEGEYTCVAKNSVGRALCSACIIVDVPEEKENLLSRQLARPSGLLSASSTPRSTPRTTPNRSVSPLRLSFRHTSIDLTSHRRTVAAPKFYAIPHNKVVEEGDSVRFQCAIAGHPTPWSTWDKDGLIVTPTTRISVKEIEDLRILEIDEVTFDDAGLYRITLENDYGRIEATARLDVIGSSKYSRSPSGRAVRSSSSKRNFFISRRIMGPSTRIGGRMALSTGIRGSSVPARKFYHNGEEVMESERVQIILTDSEAYLIVDNVTEADEGVYTCVAEDDSCVQATSTWVVFYDEDADIPRDPPIILSHLPKTLVACEGEATDLSFELESFEPYTYVWTRNGEVLPDSSEFKYIDHGNGIICLRIQDTFDLDTGLYECSVTTAYGTCKTTCDLQVDDRQHAASSDEVDRSGLALLKRPLPVLGTEGMITSFCAKVHPANAPSNWSVCGRDVTADSRNFSLEESPSDGVRILHVLGLDYTHSGEVQFTVRSPIRPKTDRITTYTTIAVLPGLPKPSHFQLEAPNTEEVSAVPAYINQGPADCTALIGETVRLRVTFGGYPVPAVKWFKAGRPITEGFNTRVCTTPGQSILELTSITADDSGKYTVEIMNDHSSDFAAASVAVEGPPEPPSGKPSISKGPDRVAVAWCGPPYDGGCMITGFIIEMQNEGDGVWKEIASVVDSLAYTVKNLTPQTGYRFRVRAENIHGRSDPSLPSDRVEISDPEVLHEDFQKTISIKSGGDFKGRFEILEELGKGRFGVVYRVQEKDTAQILAAKVIKCIKSRDRQKVQEEISIMQSLQHPKLLQLAASFESPREIVMVMEYITGGELFERVVADDFTLTERDCILFLRQVCEGVDYMHSQSIVHLDLKPENIMCHTRTSHQIKIIDFGLAQRLNTDSPVRVLFGTPEFIPPEIINYEPISFQSDMWSVGVICYVLLSGLSPFMGDSDVDTFANITRADYDFEDEAFDAVSQEAKDFISNLLVHRKEDRLTAKQCLESSWLSQHHDENLSNNKICTDKLKKFIIRRKWQKTGNAIRALGRMANLSASRRNSAVSAAGSVPNSPRPSISGASMLNPNISAHMTSLNEEEDDFNPDLPNLELKLNVRNSLKVRDKTQCSERSDSGFSECSNCSGGGNASCHCPNLIMDRSQPPAKDAEEDHNPMSVAVPHDVLKTKLEEIAKSQLVEHDGSESKPMNPKAWDSKSQTIQKAREVSLSPRERSPELELGVEHKTLTMTAEAVPIMRSDFTNTIKMRKKSLENNLAKEKVKLPKVIPETSGKVSLLKSKFSQAPQASLKSVSNQFECKTNPIPSLDVSKSRNVFDRLTSSTKSNATSKTCASVSLPSSPLPVRSAATVRLSGRVREATERLSQPKTPQATRKFINTTITPTSNDIPLKKPNSNPDHHQAKNFKTYKGLS